MQERHHVKTVPGEPHAVPEYTPHSVHREEGGNVQMDDINIPLVSTVVAFFAVLLVVTIIGLQAWFYNQQAAERAAKTLPQEDPQTWLGSILTQQRGQLHSAGAAPTTTAPNAPLRYHMNINDAMAAVQKEYAGGAEPMILGRKNFVRRTVSTFLSVVALVAAGNVALAQYRPDRITDAPPVAVDNPTIVARPNAQIPLDAQFTRSDGVQVTLAELFDSRKPVALSMVYFSCPMLCGLNQTVLAERVRAGVRSLKLGTDYDIVVVSIDPDDTPASAAAKRETYLQKMSRPASQPGFIYLTGSKESIRKLADAIGFGYRRNSEGDKYLHSTGVFVCTPYGRLSKTITNLDFTSDELHAALLAAAEGKIGSGILEQVALPCGAMRLNPLTGRYEANPWFWAGTAGGVASIGFMAIFLGAMRRGEWKRKHLGTGTPPAASYPGAPGNPPTGP